MNKDNSTSFLNIYDHDHPHSALNYDYTEKQPTTVQQKPWIHYLCCICFPCIPLWARTLSCLLLVVIIVASMVVGILIGTFKIPTIDYYGSTLHPDHLPPFERNKGSSGFVFNMGLEVGITNQNRQDIQLEQVEIVAYYPSMPDQPVGGGLLYNVHLPGNAVTNITFPFRTVYRAEEDRNHTMLNEIVDLCIIKANTDASALTFHYTVFPVVKVLSIYYKPVYHGTANVTCPIQGKDLLPLIKDMVESYLPRFILGGLSLHLFP
ncbi:hypothetical protein BDF14DRAFT_1809222 [Spinellus fusiger]|nr:hypothetical protein BDF14DRAFT_1809222 [Spinellus fusiger]